MPSYGRLRFRLRVGGYVETLPGILVDELVWFYELLVSHYFFAFALALGFAFGLGGNSRDTPVGAVGPLVTGFPIGFS